MRAGLRTREGRDRLRQLAGLGFHLLLPVYLLGLFLTLLQWNDPAPLGHLLSRYLMHGARLGMLAMLAATAWMPEEGPAGEGKSLPGLNPKGMLWPAGALALAFVITEISQPWYLFDFLLMIFLSRLADEKITARILLWTAVLLAGILVMSRELGWTLDRFDMGKAKISSFGLSNINSLAAFWFTGTLLAWTVWFRKRPAVGAVLCVGMAAGIFFYTRCNTAAVLLAVFPLLRQGIVFAGKKKPGALKAAAAGPAALAAVSLGLMGYYLSRAEITDPKGALGTFLQRFSDGALAIREHGVSLLGQPISASYVTDNLYLYTLTVFGAVGLVLMLCGWSWSLERMRKAGKWDFLAIGLLFLVYSLMESVTVLLPVYHFIPVLALSRGAEEDRPEPLPALTRKTKTGLGAGIVILAAAAALAVPGPETYGVPRRVIRTSAPEVSKPLSAETDAKQTFLLREERMLGAELLMAVGKEKPEGVLVFTLEDEDGNALEEQRVNAALARDNRYLAFYFDKSYPAGRYALRVRAEEGLKGQVMLRQNKRDRYADGAVWQDGKETKDDWLLNAVIQTVPGRWARIAAAAAAAAMGLALIGFWPGKDGKKRT